ncbi:MAG: hypothetical protein U9O54_02150 [Chloroflexota bacterium]|nr:hypothetical protein [Chloroflexota bacterium]
MTIATINSEFALNIPPQFQEFIQAGDKVSISVDSSGRLIITPIEIIRARLQETFGMWADRDDIPADSVDYVNAIREGNRLDGLNYETD